MSKYTYPWQVLDDGISREAALRMVEFRERCGGWEGYEFRITPSQFYEKYTFQVEGRKKESHEQAL